MTKRSEEFEKIEFCLIRQRVNTFNHCVNTFLMRIWRALAQSDSLISRACHTESNCCQQAKLMFFLCRDVDSLLNLVLSHPVELLARCQPQRPACLVIWGGKIMFSPKLFTEYARDMHGWLPWCTLCFYEIIFPQICVIRWDWFSWTYCYCALGGDGRACVCACVRACVHAHTCSWCHRAMRCNRNEKRKNNEIPL